MWEDPTETIGNVCRFIDLDTNIAIGSGSPLNSGLNKKGTMSKKIASRDFAVPNEAVQTEDRFHEVIRTAGS